MDRNSFIYKNFMTILNYELVPWEADAHEDSKLDYSMLSMRNIYDFATTLDISDVKPMLLRQARYNNALANEGFEKEDGANIGRIMMEQSSNVHNLARARTVAALDAWASGSRLPVIVNADSVYQGIGVCLPLQEYAMEEDMGQSAYYRSLVISNLSAISFKRRGGENGEFSSSVCSGLGVAAAVCYLRGGSYEDITKVMRKTYSITQGLNCTDDEPLGAAKLALGVEAGLLAVELWHAGRL